MAPVEDVVTAGAAMLVGDDFAPAATVVVQSHSSAAGGMGEVRVGGNGYSPMPSTTTAAAAHCSLADGHYGYVQGGVATAMLTLQTRALAEALQDHYWPRNVVMVVEEVSAVDSVAIDSHASHQSSGPPDFYCPSSQWDLWYGIYGDIRGSNTWPGSACLTSTIPR